jgi:serine/threonine protein phosphatase PrpC
MLDFWHFLPNFEMTSRPRRLQSFPRITVGNEGLTCPSGFFKFTLSISKATELPFGISAEERGLNLEEKTLAQVDAASRTDRGRVRPNNEDSYGSFEPDDPQMQEKKGSLYIVADGMGGHKGGEVASRLAVESIHSRYSHAGTGDPAASLVDAFQEANQLIFQKSQSDESLTGMGTTCTAMVIRAEFAYFAHVGDSRAYLLRQGRLKQITQDHSLIGEMLRSGLISREDARTHPQRNVITKSLGAQPTVQVDTPSSPFAFEEGDVFLLCSDGLTTLVTNEEIAEALRAQTSAEACNQLIDLANRRGGTDNVTVQVIAIRK